MGRLTGCCCCFDLRDGARAIGITMLALGSLGLVFQVINIAMLAPQQHSQMDSAILALIMVQFAVGILHIIMNALLVHGVNKNSRGMLLAWLIYSGIIYGLESLAMVIVFVIACITGVWWFILLVLGLTGLIGVFWYWFVVVLHHYQETNDANGFVYGTQEDGGEKHAM